MNDTLDNSGLNQTGSGGASDDNSACPLIGLIPFSVNGEDYPSYMVDFGYTHMAAALLAVDHFNERNPVVVPQLADPLAQDCSVELPEPLFANTNAVVENTASFLVDVSKGEYCGMVGPFNNKPTLAAANFALGLEIPMISHGAYDIQVSGQKRFPLTGRTCSQIHSLTEVLLSFMRSHGRTDYLSTIAPIDEGGLQYMTVADHKAKQAGVTGHITFSTRPPFEDTFQPNDGIGYAIQKTKEAGYRNIFFVMRHVETLSIFAKYAEQFGMLNGEYFWMTSGDIDFEQVSELASIDANVSKLVRGLTSFRWLDGFEYDYDNDRMLQAWRNQNETFVDRLNSLHPVQNNGTPGYFQAEADYFQTSKPHRGAGFIYDAVMSVALGKCKEIDSASSSGSVPQGPPGSQGLSGSPGPQGGGRDIFTERQDGAGRPEGPTRRRVKGEKALERMLQTKKQKKLNPHLQGIVNSWFEGATGTVAFQNGTSHVNRQFPGNRLKVSLTYGVYNFRLTDTSDESSGLSYFLTDTLDIQNTGVLDGTWIQTKDGPFTFASGLTTPPLLNRDPPEANYLSRGVHITGLTFMAIALFLASLSAVALFLFRTKAPIREAQPPFLYMFMFGTAMMSCAIFTFSFDESYGWSDSMLSAACMASQWLISLGYNMIYLAMFSKLWRINRVMSLTRRVVHARHAVFHFVIAMVATILTLTIWTVVDPVEWRREVVNEVTGETYGKCTNDNPVYFSFVVVLMGLSTLACGFMAYQCRNIDSRFSESKWIFYTFFVQIQVLMVGIPILVILNTSSSDATYLGRSLLIFVVAVSALALMFGPKIVALWQDIKSPSSLPVEGREQVRSTATAGSGGTRGSDSKRRSVGSGSVKVYGVALKQSAEDSIRLKPTERIGSSGLMALDSNLSSGEFPLPDIEHDEC